MVLFALNWQVFMDLDTLPRRGKFPFTYFKEKACPGAVYREAGDEETRKEFCK